MYHVFPNNTKLELFVYLYLSQMKKEKEIVTGLI